MLARLFASLASRHGWSNLSTENQNRLRERVEQHVGFSKISRSEIVNLFTGDPHDFSMYRDHRFVLLAPSEKERNVLPAFSLACENEWRNFRLYLLLFTFDSDSMVTLGFRFESPERPGQQLGGNHNFFHLQMLDQDTNTSIPLLTWMPIHQPSVPLGAKSWVGIVLAMLIAVYGARDATKLLKEESISVPGISKYANELDALVRPS